MPDLTQLMGLLSEVRKMLNLACVQFDQDCRLVESLAGKHRTVLDSYYALAQKHGEQKTCEMIEQMKRDAEAFDPLPERFEIIKKAMTGTRDALNVIRIPPAGQGETNSSS